MRKSTMLYMLMLVLGLAMLAACGQAEPEAVGEIARAAQMAEEIAAAAEVAASEQPATTPAMGTMSAPAIAPIELAPSVELPRSVTYANLEWTVTEAVIDNTTITLFGDSTERTNKYCAARMTLRINNPLSGYTNLDSNIVKLQLGDGEYYTADETGRPILPGGNDTTESRLIFRLPANATWDGAKLLISEADRVPAELPLDGPMPASTSSLKLAITGGASADEVVYTLLESSLELDLHAERAKIGERFLTLTMRVENQSSGGGGLPLSDEYFRMRVNGTLIAPAADFAELVKPNSTYDATVVFAVPEDLSQAELMVGEDDATAAITLDLTHTTQ